MARLKIGLLLKDKTPGFWVLAEKGAQEAAQALDVDLIVKAPPTVLDVSAQSRLLAALVAEKPDVLIVAPINPDALAGALSELAKTGLKIVTLDTPLPEGIAQVFVGADQSELGETAAKVFLSLVRDGEETALLRNNSLDRPVLAREDKLREAVKSRPGLIFHCDIFASSDKNSEDEQAMLLLGKHPGTTVIFASATRGTLATIKAVREKGLVGKVKVVGFGTYLPAEVARAFEDGILYGWVAQEPKDMGAKAIRSAVALAGNQNAAAIVRPDYQLVTRENFHSPEVQALLNP